MRSVVASAGGRYIALPCRLRDLLQRVLDVADRGDQLVLGLGEIVGRLEVVELLFDVAELLRVPVEGLVGERLVARLARTLDPRAHLLAKRDDLPAQRRELLLVPVVARVAARDEHEAGTSGIARRTAKGPPD